jgi:4'-phosphopantetheinyl transferase
MFDLGHLKQVISQHLACDHAVVFAATLDQLQGFNPVLTTNEQARFDRVRLPEQRRLHGLGRGLVRYFLDLPSRDFSVGFSGKPMWTAAASFNISHTGRTIAVALNRRGNIGVDIETRSRGLRDEDLIKRVCHPQEARWIARYGAPDQTQEFLRCWVRKEAVLKAWGTGLVDDLHKINTCLQDRFVVVPGKEELRLWDFPTRFSVDPGALATDRDVARTAYVSPKVTVMQCWPDRQGEPAAGALSKTVDHDPFF